MLLDRWQGAEQEFAAGPHSVELFRALEGKGVLVFRPEDNVPRGFLRNSGQCYIHSNLFEVCTPECRNSLELVAYEKACEAYARLASWALEENTGKKVHLYKTNIASDIKREGSYTTVGSHENYLVNRESYLDNISLLVPYLIIRQIFCGAGGYVDGQYLVSPRVIFPKSLYSETSTDYPIISTRDEAHTSDAFSRAHIVNGEGSRSDYTTFLKYSITSYILKAIETCKLTKVPELDAALELNKSISYNIEGEWRVQLTDGTYIKATDYFNAYYLEPIEKVFADSDTKEHDNKALKEFKWTLRKLDEGLIESLDNSIEWVIKKKLCNMVDEINVDESLSIEEKQMIAMNQYTAVTDPLYDDLTERYGIKNIVTEKDVEKAFLNPPRDSRGKLRVEASRRFKGYLKTISWSYLKLDPGIHYYPVEFNELDGWTTESINRRLTEIEGLIESKSVNK